MARLSRKNRRTRYKHRGGYTSGTTFMQQLVGTGSEQFNRVMNPSIGNIATQHSLGLNTIKNLDINNPSSSLPNFQHMQGGRRRRKRRGGGVTPSSTQPTGSSASMANAAQSATPSSAPSAPSTVNTLKGGKRRRRGGSVGSLIYQAAAPSILVGLQNVYGRKSRKGFSHSSSKRRITRRRR